MRSHVSSGVDALQRARAVNPTIIQHRFKTVSMSRPVSMKELLGKELISSKPKFISKKKRDKIKQEKPEAPAPVPVKRAPTLPQRGIDQPTDSEPPITKKPRKSDASNKFSFEWNDDEDTSPSYQPLVMLDPAEQTVDMLSKSASWEQKALDDMTARDWRILKNDFRITYKGEGLSQPLRMWSEEELLPQKLLDILVGVLGYSQPTPIQRAAVPLALRHKDIVGIAETGSGKTLAYLLPILTYLLQIEKTYMDYEHSQEANHNRALALVLAPTRELALQITTEAQKFAKLLGFSVITIIGGHQYEETIHSLRNGVHIIVATPGRLVDSLERGIVSLQKCYHLTLDEADKMIDMGFEKSLLLIFTYLPSTQDLTNTLDSKIFGIEKRSTLMFTATITAAIEKITKNYLILPGYVFIGNANELVDNIDQKFEYFDDVPQDKQALDDSRLKKLLKVLENHKRHHDFSVIIFANYKRLVELLAEKLMEKNFGSVAVVHGSKSQESRERALEAFRARHASILIATDVAARGIDVPHVSLVVNFQMSNKFEEYVHRIGRTGRAGKSGESFTFIDDSDKETFAGLKKFLSAGGYRIPNWLYNSS